MGVWHSGGRLEPIRSYRLIGVAIVALLLSISAIAQQTGGGGGQSGGGSGTTYTGLSPIVVTGPVISCPTCGTGTGNVTGPVSSTGNDVAAFNGATGKIILDTGLLYTNIVTAVSPGIGLCHFAGSTQACTSSLVNLAADVTGQLPIGAVGSAGLSATSPVTISAVGVIACATCNTSSSNVNSITGDGTIFNNSLSTGAVTLTLANTVTGTGGVVLANTPTLVTPVLGAATGTSLALGGGTALATTNQTGTGSLVLANSPTLVTPALGTPSAIVLTSGTGLPISTGLSGAGTGVLTALGNATNATGGLVGFSGALGTPTSGTLTNATGLPVNGIVSATGTIATIANGNNPLTINCAQTSNTQSCVAFGETTAATGGSANNEFAISTAANSTSIVLNVTQGAISTVFPTAAVNITQGANTGATNVPALNISTTLNNASLTGGVMTFAVSNTSSAGTQSFINFLGGAAAGTTEAIIDLAGNFRAAGNFESTATTGNSVFTGGVATASSNGALGGATFQGSHNSSNGSSVKAGYNIVSSGILSNATPNAAALEGVVEIQAGYLKGTAIANVGDVVCGTTTAFTVTDCALAASNIVGIADTTTNPVGVIGYGTALVKFDGATTLGDTACGPPTAAGTAGLAHDNGTTACVLGSAVGVIIANSGTITVASATTTAAVAMSSTLALVQLHISQ